MTVAPSPRVVGLIGGIGSGKSQVARLFAERGAAIVSGDEAGHEALRQPAIREQVVQRWGAGILDAQGEINRRQLGGIVFAKQAELHTLESIVHPWIKQRLREQLAPLRSNPAVPLVILDAAILVEAGWDDLCDAIIFVEVPRDIRLERIIARRGWTEKEVADREQAQLPVEDKARLAQYRLDNSGSLDDLRIQVADLWRTLVPAQP